MEKEVAYSLSSQNSSSKDSQDGLSLKMFQDFLTATKERISEFSCKRWMNSGIAYHGEYLMQNISEHHNGAEESMLSEVLETTAQLRYFLTTSQLQSLLQRALDRGKSLDPDLETLIRKQLHTLSSTPQLEESIQLDRRQRATGMTEKHIPLIHVEELMLYVRRLMPSECERLQGFPQGWTEADIEQ